MNVLGEEEYANAYYYFHKTLVILTKSAEEQCEAMGRFNVAWEIREDVLKQASAVLNLSGEKLSKEQREGIQNLVTDTTTIPDTVVNVSNSNEEHIHAMSNPCWIPIRKRAKKLVSLLESETKRTNAILGISA